jgi:hypothetical protein
VNWKDYWMAMYWVNWKDYWMAMHLVNWMDYWMAMHWVNWKDYRMAMILAGVHQVAVFVDDPGNDLTHC